MSHCALYVAACCVASHVTNLGCPRKRGVSVTRGSLSPIPHHSSIFLKMAVLKAVVVMVVALMNMASPASAFRPTYSDSRELVEKETKPAHEKARYALIRLSKTRKHFLVRALTSLHGFARTSTCTPGPMRLPRLPLLIWTRWRRWEVLLRASVNRQQRTTGRSTLSLGSSSLVARF